MILNRLEFLAMNNPLRALMQRRFEARRLCAMGGPATGGRALEIGCGRGVGVEIILDQFAAASVDAFDLDPRMIERARKRLGAMRDRVRLSVGDATRIEAPTATYDAVFDFGIIHHIPDWRKALAEVLRVLRPGGRFYAEEILADWIMRPIWRRLLDHPTEDRFDHRQFIAGLEETGFTIVAAKRFGRSIGWYVADKPEAT